MPFQVKHGPATVTYVLCSSLLRGKYTFKIIYFLGAILYTKLVWSWLKDGETARALGSLTILKTKLWHLLWCLNVSWALQESWPPMTVSHYSQYCPSTCNWAVSCFLPEKFCGNVKYSLTPVIFFPWKKGVLCHTVGVLAGNEPLWLASVQEGQTWKRPIIITSSASIVQLHATQGGMGVMEETSLCL